MAVGASDGEAMSPREREMQDPPPAQRTARFGEVIEASTTGFKVQCYELYEAPFLGSLVWTGGPSAIYGIVYDVTTASMDPARHPIARGRDEESEGAVYRNNPQLSRLLSTEASSVVVGHRSSGEMVRRLPPLPARIHSFAHICTSGELRELSASLEFLPALLSSPWIMAPDDVTAAFLLHASAAHPAPREYLVEAGKELAAALSGDVRRLNGILKRLSSG